MPQKRNLPVRVDDPETMVYGHVMNHITPTPPTTATQDIVAIAKVMNDSIEADRRMMVAARRLDKAEADRLQNSSFDLEQEATAMIARFEKVHGCCPFELDEMGEELLPAHPAWTVGT